jgi:hypothetical protein
LVVVGTVVGWVVGCVVVVVGGWVVGWEMVIVVGPCGPLVVVTMTRRFVVVGVVASVVVVTAAVVVAIVVGRRATVDVSDVTTVTPGPAGSWLWGGLAALEFALTAATVASTVASPTPDTDRMTMARDLARLSVGGAI